MIFSRTAYVLALLVLEQTVYAAKGSTRRSLAVCMNSEMDASLNDEGCEWWDNLCVLNDGTEPALGGDGDKCVRPTCVNTVSSIFGVDHDCSPWYNRCVSDVGIDPGDDPLQLGVAGTQCIHSTPSGPGGALDVVILVDLSGSFGDDVAEFKDESVGMIQDIKAVYPNARFGLGAFIDFPFNGWGSTNGVGPDDDDYPYKRILDLTDDEDAVIDAIQDPDVLKIQNGADFPESQLTAIHQAITGEGLEVPDESFTLLPNQNMNFENGAMKVIVMWTDATHHTPDFPSGYPGPSVQDVVDAALAEGIIGGRRNLQTETTNGFTIRIVGINAGGDSVQTELENLALKTGAIAPFGLKCCRTCAESTPTEGDAPIVCPSVDGVNIGESIVAVVMTAVNSAEVQIAGGSTTSGSSGGGVLPPPGGDCCDLTGRPCQHDNLGDDTCFEMQDGTCPHGTTDICSWVCTNDKWYRDSGCEDPGVQGKKVCVYLDGTEPNRDQEGEKCVVCINNKATGKDRGCTLNKPNCKFNGAEPISGGKVGNQCV